MRSIILCLTFFSVTCLLVTYHYHWYNFNMKDMKSTKSILNESNESRPYSVFELDFQKCGRTHIYSAYFDVQGPWNQGKRDVTIIASEPRLRGIDGLKEFQPQQLICQFYKEVEMELVSYLIVRASVKKIPPQSPTHQLHIAYYITCDIENNATELPAFVRVVKSDNSTNPDANCQNMIRIKYNFQSIEKYKFSVCVQPLYGSIDSMRLVEWIEFHKLMGVKKFTFYNYSIQEETACLLKSYGNLTEVLPWSFPFEIHKLSRDATYGQDIAMHECLYRHKQISNFVLFVDLDEMIVPAPAAGSDYAQMIKTINEDILNRNLSADSIASYNFKNGFFFTKWNSNATTAVDNNETDSIVNRIYKQLYITKSVRRKIVQEDYGDRSKYIVIPEKVSVLTIHKPIETVPNTILVYNVPVRLAYLHHYRDGCVKNLCKGSRRITENSALRFGHQVANNVKYQLYHTGENHCQFLNETTYFAEKLNF